MAMTTYKDSGVDIDAGNRAVQIIKPAVNSTHNRSVLSSIGGFAAGFQLDMTKYKNPILVSCTDGVGTKLRLAIQANKFDSIGVDLVAMSVNDLICMGADPLFFLDYYACHKIEPEQVKLIIEGIAAGCRESNTALIGGEMAEMNDMYSKKDFDLAGFCVGIVDKDKIIDGSSISEGDNVYAFASSGIHSNGYSLVRKIYAESKLSSELSIEELLTPTRIYVKTVQELRQKISIRGIAHITGGGLAENLERIMPENKVARLNKNSIKVLEVFKKLQRYGNVSEQEMYRVFNMGVGLVIVTPDELEQSDDCYKIGSIESGERGVFLE
jgi:phosphoribosylformylglycinamidine cyclo-ligase